MLRVCIWMESFRCAGILLCNGNVKTLRIDNIWNFATFNMYTVRGKILYLQAYSTDFRNLCFSSKMLKVDIWVESFRCAGILLLQSHLKLSTQMSTLNIFELKQWFRKSLECPWRYRIFPGTVYMLKVAKFQMLSIRKVFTLPLQKQNTCASEAIHPNVHPQHVRAEPKFPNIGSIPLEI